VTSADSDEDARETKSGVRDPSYAHGIVVKMGAQDAFSFFDHFEELLFDRIGVPPRSLAANVEQIRQKHHDRIEDTIFEMNKFVVDKNRWLALPGRTFPTRSKQSLGCPGAGPDEADRRPYQADLLCLYLSQLVCADGRSAKPRNPLA